MLVAGYKVGRTPIQLLIHGTRTTGIVVEVKEISFQRGRNYSTTEFLPIIEFQVEGKKFRFQGTNIANSKSTGYSTNILIDPEDPSFAMQDHSYLNWFPWSFFAVIGLILTFAGLNGFKKRGRGSQPFNWIQNHPNR